MLGCWGVGPLPPPLPAPGRGWGSWFVCGRSQRDRTASCCAVVSHRCPAARHTSCAATQSRRAWRPSRLARCLRCLQPAVSAVCSPVCKACSAAEVHAACWCPGFTGLCSGLAHMPSKADLWARVIPGVGLSLEDTGPPDKGVVEPPLCPASHAGSRSLPFHREGVCLCRCCAVREAESGCCVG